MDSKNMNGLLTVQLSMMESKMLKPQINGCVNLRMAAPGTILGRQPLTWLQQERVIRSNS
jgi:hypothetical protein